MARSHQESWVYTEKRMSKPLVWLIVAICAIGLYPARSQADTLDNVKRKGVLVVGTKADYAPFGFLDASGNIVGLEADLAGDVAKRLGVKLELVPVTSANRMQLLQEGKIDLMIATMSVTPEREKAVGIISPHYYATRIGVLAPKSANIKDETDLKGKRICALAGVFFNDRLKTEFTQQDLLVFNSTIDNEAALLADKCVGFALCLFPYVSDRNQSLSFIIILIFSRHLLIFMLIALCITKI